MEDLYWNFKKQNDVYDNGDFGVFYQYLKEYFQKGIYKVYPSVQLGDEVLEAFTERMKRITIRTLIFEMQVSEQYGDLEGSTDIEKYKFFANELLSDENYLKELYKQYPIMYRHMINELQLAVDGIIELLNRFELDKDGINKRFFNETRCNKIEKICGGNSDSHNGGRKVYILELDNGEKLVYKPRCLEIDEKCRELFQWIFENVNVSFWWNQVWDRTEYGWCEWVLEESCITYEQLEAYYKRNGILLCISYLLGSEDLHYENLIAHGEHPIIIDMEMMIGSRRLEDSQFSETERVYKESVLRTGLLPLYMWNENGEGVNVSAIDGSGGQLVPILIPVIVQAGTVNMNIEYRHPVMGEGKNLAKLNGIFIPPIEFLEKIQDGFQITYDFIQTHKEQVWRKLQAFCNTPIRYLIRDTQQYISMLMLSYHPRVLMEEHEKMKFLYQNCFKQEDDKRRQWTTKQEVEELLRGDIPYFWYYIDDTQLYSGTENVYKNYFATKTVFNIKKRLFQMCDMDYKRQKRWIEASLRLGVKEIKSDRNRTIQNELNITDIEEKGIKIAKQIGNLLLENAIWSDKEDDVGWISMILAGYRERSFLIRPMNLYLYDGIAGIVVFIKKLADVVCDKNYQKIVDILLHKLYRHTEDMLVKEDYKNWSSGAFSGEASIAYAYCIMLSQKDDEKMKEYLYKQCQVISKIIPYDENYDVMGGNAGAILVLLLAFELIGNKEYLLWAEQAGEHLIQNAIKYPWGVGWINSYEKKALTGFAHGSSGMLLALAKLGYYSKKQKYYDASYQAYLFEEHYYDEDAEDWVDLRNGKETCSEATLAWCHGRGGIVMARKVAQKYVTGEFREVLKQKTASCYDVIENGYSLCHGMCGNIGFWMAVGKEKVAKLWKMNMIEELMNCENIKEKMKLQECENFGLMSGIVGVGYSCLCSEKKIEKLLVLEKM